MTTVTFSDGRDHPASYLVYFNGIEIPTLQVTVNFGVWEIPTAYIEIAPDPVMQRIGAEDRIQVAVFYLDDTYGTEFDFRLLFEGEITGWDVQNSPLGRRIGFTCVSHLRVLNEIFQYFITGIKSWANVAMSLNPAQNQTVSGVAPFVDMLFHGLDLKNRELVKRPFDILRNMLGVCLKKKVQEVHGSVAMKHFFAALSRRIDFVNRFVPSPVLEIDILGEDPETSAGIFSILYANRRLGVINQIMGRAEKYADAVSMWSLLRRLFTDMYYEILAIPAPPVAQVRKSNGAIVGRPEWPTAKEGHANRILNFLTKPQWLYGVPPACNVIFPSMIQQFNYGENYAEQPTRVNISDTYWTRLWKFRKHLSDKVFDIKVAYPDQAQEELDKILEAGGKGNLRETGRNFLVWPEEFFKGPRCEELILPDLFHHLNESAGVQAAADPEVGEDMAVDHKRIQRTYAEYEYQRRRGMRRNGSVATIFNPYFVFGFPCMVFDKTSFIHAYAMKGSHTLSQAQMSTNIEYTFGQTISELLGNVIAARQEGHAIDIAPAYPVQQVKEVIQVYDVAERYFSELLHQAGGYSGNKTAAFNFLTGLSLKFEKDKDQLAGEAIKNPKLFTDHIDVGPGPDFATRFESPDSAMKYIARPVTTLEEYICFHPRGIKDLASGKVGKGKVEAFSQEQGKGAVFYEEILNFTQGPGEAPTYDVANKAYQFQQTVPPDTRADWRSRLISYRKRIIFQLHGQG